jgi:hypothetical protein
LAIPFPNIIKAQVTQSLIASLLERGGYRVTRLGIEELIGEIKALNLDEYHNLGLPTQLRTLPDLLVANKEMTEIHLVEVKYRRRFDPKSRQSLYKELSKQREYWQGIVAIIVIGESFLPGGRLHQDYIRVLPGNETGRLIKQPSEDAREANITEEERWTSLPMIQHVFRSFLATEALYKYADYLTRVIKELKKL